MNYTDLAIVCNQVCDVLDSIGMVLYVPKFSQREIFFCDICGNNHGVFFDEVNKYVYFMDNFTSYRIDLNKFCIHEGYITETNKE